MIEPHYKLFVLQNMKYQLYSIFQPPMPYFKKRPNASAKQKQRPYLSSDLGLTYIYRMHIFLMAPKSDNYAQQCTTMHYALCTPSTQPIAIASTIYEKHIF